MKNKKKEKKLKVEHKRLVKWLRVIIVLCIAIIVVEVGYIGLSYYYWYNSFVYTDTLYLTNLELSQDESIRNAISDGNDICISIMNERDTETFTTKNTILVDFDKLKKSISVLTS